MIIPKQDFFVATALQRPLLIWCDSATPVLPCSAILLELYHLEDKRKNVAFIGDRFESSSPRGKSLYKMTSKRLLS